MGPSARYTRDLVKEGYVGRLRGVHMTVSADAFFPEMSEKHRWAFDASNFSNVLSIYAAHFGDMLFRSVGFPRKLTAVIETQFPFFTVVETGQRVPNTNPNEVMVIGTLEGGGLFSMQVEGAQRTELAFRSISQVRKAFSESRTRLPFKTRTTTLSKA